MNTLVITDVDGVITDGAQYVSHDGYVFKKFLPGIGEVISILKEICTLYFVSNGVTGQSITEKFLLQWHEISPKICYSLNERYQFVHETIMAFIDTRYSSDIYYVGDSISDLFIGHNIQREFKRRREANGSNSAHAFTFVPTSPMLHEILRDELAFKNYQVNYSYRINSLEGLLLDLIDIHQIDLTEIYQRKFKFT